ncbi:hypothetical protein [uncultured Rothia sp.]
MDEKSKENPGEANNPQRLIENKLPAQLMSARIKALLGLGLHWS